MNHALILFHTWQSSKKGISFHKFPTDRIIKKKWEVVLRMAMKSDFVKTKKCDYTYSLNILYCIYNIVYCLFVYCDF